MATSSPAPAPRTTLGALTHELDTLRADAVALFASYEDDVAVPELLDRANTLGARSYRIAAALGQIAEGLEQL